MNIREAALQASIKIFENRHSADEILPAYITKVFSPQEFNALISGLLKSRLKLDYIIEQVSQRKIKNIKSTIRNCLRLALYELTETENPEYAVINSYTELAKRDGSKAAGFTNAILRKYTREKDSLKYPDSNTPKGISVQYSHPEWMVKSWIKQYGIEETKAICEHNNSIPKLTIRINTIKTAKEDLIKLFDETNIQYKQSAIADECLEITHAGSIKKLPGFDEGFWAVQGEASILTSIVLSPQPNENILDVCAAPGGKTAHIAALMSNTGHITALDLEPKRLDRIKENCKRLGITNVKTLTADAAAYTSDELYDRIITDVPCSNTGVLSKRPDARWLRRAEDIKKLAELQYKIIENASKFVKIGGTLVYSTCSIEKEENEEVVNKFLNNYKNFKLDVINNEIPWKLSSDSGLIQIVPSKHKIDGFFIAKLIKTR